MPPPSDPKRVLLMVSSMRGGGSERQVLLLARALDRDRFQPHLYLTEATGEFLDQVPRDIPIHSFDSQSDPGGIYVPGRQLRRQTEFLRGVIEKHAIEVVYDRTFHMTLLAGRAAAGIRRVSTIVSPPHLALPLVETRFVGLKRRRLAAAYRAADAVVAVSAQAAKSAESYYGLDSGSVLVIKNPVDLERLTQSAERPSPEQDESSRDRDTTRLVCVGRMTEEKGHADLLVALASVRDRWPRTRQPFSIRLVGEGPLRLALQSQARTLRLTEQVTFVGAVSDAAGEIAGADALILPSRFEGLPNVVLEAMALGTPVIATRAGGAVALQRDETTAFWAQPGDAQSIADAILQFAREPQTAEKQRDAALDLILAEHDVNTIVRQIEDLLDPTVGSH